MATYDRYSQFRDNGEILKVPFIKIPKSENDYHEVYRRNQTRLDLLSYQYYDDPGYAWLIMQANPECGALEYSIPDGAVLRIPMPLNEVLLTYRNNVEKYFRENGE